MCYSGGHIYTQICMYGLYFSKQKNEYIYIHYVFLKKYCYGISNITKNLKVDYSGR